KQKYNNMKNFIKFTLVLILFYMTSNTKIMAQYIATLADNIAGYSDSVKNTGNAIIPYPNSNQNFRAMVWDGDSSAFFWKNDYNLDSGIVPLSGNHFGEVKDPDIVLGIDGSIYAFIVYLLNGSVYYEVWRYNGLNSWTNTVSPTQINQQSGIECHSPNVDILLGLGAVAITYEEDSYIKLLAGSVTGANITNQAIYDVNSDSRDPDVSVYRYFDNIINQLVYVTNVTYINQQGNSEELWISKFDLWDLVTNTMPPGTFTNTSIDNVGTSGGDGFGVPRTASTEYCDNEFDYQIVVLKRMGAEYFINSYNYNNPNSPYLVNENTLFGSLVNAPNFKPSIGYAGDECVVAWTLDDSQVGLGGGYIDDVISRQLYSYDGIGSSQTAYDVFSFVNTYTNDVQGVSSVDGRYTTNSINEKLITFYDEANQVVKYKSVQAGVIQFRKPKTTLSTLYPNPASTNLNIQLQPDFEHTTIQIYNYLGSKVMETKADKNNMNLDVSSLPSGLYFVKVLSLTNTETIFFEIIK
ncbi:MAG: T9SS type A sorting domain-containing protein, partial [Bacteroidales bacterium]|nr:T9SS type A sorting domain-containing protein [Bacteroidales bacterium]